LPLPSFYFFNGKGKAKRACLPTNPSKKFSKMPHRTTKIKDKKVNRQTITSSFSDSRHRRQNSTGHNSTLQQAGVT